MALKGLATEADCIGPRIRGRSREQSLKSGESDGEGGSILLPYPHHLHPGGLAEGLLK